MDWTFSIACVGWAGFCLAVLVVIAERDKAETADHWRELYEAERNTNYAINLENASLRRDLYRNECDDENDRLLDDIERLRSFEERAG